MKVNHTPRRGIRLIDVPNMPLAQALALLADMPEGFGAAVAKLCYSQLRKPV